MNLVLHRAQVALNVNEFDITEQVAEQLNKILPSVLIPPDGVSAGRATARPRRVSRQRRRHAAPPAPAAGRSGTPTPAPQRRLRRPLRDSSQRRCRLSAGRRRSALLRPHRAASRSPTVAAAAAAAVAAGGRRCCFTAWRRCRPPGRAGQLPRQPPLCRRAGARPRAGAVIVHPDLADAGARRQRAAMVTAEPYLGWARVAALFHPAPPPRPGMHPSAVVEPTAADRRDGRDRAVRGDRRRRARSGRAAGSAPAR